MIIGQQTPDVTQAWIKRHEDDCNEMRLVLPEGEWTTEPDRVEFTSHGFECILLREASFFHWCGYVSVPKGHPAFGHSYEALNRLVNVHGGLSYASPCRGAICHVPKNEEDEAYWFGFDCAHASDLAPGIRQHLREMPDLTGSAQFMNLLSSYETYRNVEFVRKETEELAAQLWALQINQKRITEKMSFPSNQRSIK